jgi:hypothetical protein
MKYYSALRKEICASIGEPKRNDIRELSQLQKEKMLHNVTDM